MKLANAKDAVMDGLLIVGGLTIAKFGMDFLSKNPTLAPVVGALGVAPYVFDIGGSHGKKVGAALIAAGVIQAGKNFTNGKTGILGKVNAALPSLAGFNGYALAGISESSDFNLLNGIGGDPIMADDLTLMN
jgi:hypothetical protein